MRILEYFFPDRELNLQSLRDIAKEIVNGTLIPPTPQQTQTPPMPDQPSPSEEESPQEAEPVVESVNDLHQPLGCLMEDSQGRFRKSYRRPGPTRANPPGYIGAHSEIPFNAAVCSIGDERYKDSSIIAPPKVGSYPPTLPSPSPSLESSPARERYYLPPRQTCDFYVAKFLEDVHSTHWFYSMESFLNRVDNTYSGSTISVTDSWICSLYSIFAIGSSSLGDEGTRPSSSSNTRIPPDSKSTTDYISLAKELIPAVYDEADIDSTRAAAILVSTIMQLLTHKLI